MASDLHTTAAVIDYTVAIYILTTGIAPLLWSPLSGFYGRKPIYLVSMPIMAVASIGVAQSRNVGAIIGTRILQGFGGSAQAFWFCTDGHRWIVCAGCWRGKYWGHLQTDGEGERNGLVLQRS